jgi:hypothetical protein
LGKEGTQDGFHSPRYGRANRNIGIAIKRSALARSSVRIRRDAEHMTDEKIRRQLLNIAAQYDRLAESAEHRPR